MEKETPDALRAMLLRTSMVGQLICKSMRLLYLELDLVKIHNSLDKIVSKLANFV